MKRIFWEIQSKRCHEPRRHNLSEKSSACMSFSSWSQTRSSCKHTSDYYAYPSPLHRMSLNLQVIAFQNYITIILWKSSLSKPIYQISDVFLPKPLKSCGEEAWICSLFYRGCASENQKIKNKNPVLLRCGDSLGSVAPSRLGQLKNNVQRTHHWGRLGAAGLREQKRSS